MPSANMDSEDKTAIVNEMDYINHPMKPALTIVEHKIRNLEKRKVKLDQYKSEQDAGKELNADQLAAVAKYGEVIQQLDLARDLIKQLGQANNETRREIKKHRKAEVAERAMQETEKLRKLFLFQLVVKELENFDLHLSNESDDSSDLKKAVLLIKKHQFVRYSELLDMYDPNFQATVDMVVSNWMQVLDGSKKVVDSQSGKDRTTFKTIRDDLLAVANCDYFTNKRRNQPVAEVVHLDNAISDSESIPSSVTNANNSSIQETSEIEPAISMPLALALSICQIQDSAYSFLQDSQLDLESPHFDPAVVAVSSCLHPALNNQCTANFQARNAYTTATAAPEPLLVTKSNGIGDRIVSDFRQKSIMPLMDDKITEWNANDVSNELDGQNDRNRGDRNESQENDGGHKNRFGRNRGRGGRIFRGSSLNGLAPRFNSRGVGRGRFSQGNNCIGFSEGNNRIGFSEPGNNRIGFSEPWNNRIGFTEPGNNRIGFSELGNNGIGFFRSGDYQDYPYQNRVYHSSTRVQGFRNGRGGDRIGRDGDYGGRGRSWISEAQWGNGCYIGTGGGYRNGGHADDMHRGSDYNGLTTSFY